MFDPATMGAALSSAKTIFDLLKNVNDAQLAMKISAEVTNLQGRLIDVQQRALDLQNENQKLRAENEKFRSSVFHHSVNWRVLPDGSEDGPFCPVCHGEGVDMRLALRNVNQTGERWYLECPKPHRASGEPLFYTVPKNLVPPDRYFVKR